MAGLNGLARRIAALELTEAELVERRLADRLAAEHGLRPAEVYAELQAIGREIAARFGPRPDLRGLAEWMAAEHGRDADELFAEMAADVGRWRSGEWWADG
jgi:hypothetical protein